jgi:hypothetical protein
MTAGVGNEQATLTGYDTAATGALQAGAGEMNTAAGAYGTGVTGATSGLSSGLTEAQTGFNPLNTAVNNPNLQVSNQDVQNIVTAAGTTVGNQFQTAEDQLRANAAAAGNTSPEAIAAENAQLTTQEAATAGDTMTQAQIQARQYQLAALQQQTGIQATAATTEEAAAQAAAAESGLANIGAEEQIGANTQNVANTEAAQGLSEANTTGQFNVGQENTQTGQNYGAQSTAEQLASNRATTVANQAITGQGAYRSGVAQQQGVAQQGGQAAVQQQLGAYGTQTSSANTAAAGIQTYGTNQQALSLPNKLETSLANLFDDGGFVPEDMVAKVAESGPEMVLDAPKTSQVNSIMKEDVRGRYRGPGKRENEHLFGVGQAA